MHTRNVGSCLPNRLLFGKVEHGKVRTEFNFLNEMILLGIIT